MSKLSQLIFCFLFALLNLTVIPALHAENKVPTTTVEDNCNLPAPTGLSITNITAVSADAQWNAVSGAVGYSVVAKNLATQQVYFSTTTTGTAITATGLPANTNIELDVSPICGTGLTSSLSATSVFITDFVIEIVAGSFEGCTNSNPWTQLPTGQSLTFPVNAAYQLKVENPVGNTEVVNFVAHGFGYPEPLKFYPMSFQMGAVVEDGYGNANVMQGNSNVIKIEASQINQNFIILPDLVDKRGTVGVFYRPMPCGGWLPSPINGRSNDDKTTASMETTIIAAPNPFQAQFSLLTNGYQNEPATIQLYNLSGQLVQSITTVLDDQTVSVVNTEDLPDGMYIAKIQTSQTVNTIKVQKTSPK